MNFDAGRPDGENDSMLSASVADSEHYARRLANPDPRAAVCTVSGENQSDRAGAKRCMAIWISPAF